MAKHLLKKCCGCCSLHTGTIISGISAILLSIIGILLTYLGPAKLRTIVFDFLPDWIVRVIVTVNLVMTIILSIVMLIGVMKRNWVLMMPWVVLGGMLAIGLLVSIIVNSVNFYLKPDVTLGTLWLVIGLISLVVYCYMWYVCFSFFANLREESNRGAYTKDPFRRRPL